MKNQFNHPIIFFISLFISTMILATCKKDDVPTVITANITNITQNDAIGRGNITSDGCSPVTARGLCWSTSQYPTTANSKTADGSGTGNFTGRLTDLTANTIYYVRAYATNSAGTAYGGNTISFATNSVSAVFPTITTTPVTSVTTTSAISGGNITNDGGAFITASGVCWSTSQNPTVVF